MEVIWLIILEHSNNDNLFVIYEQLLLWTEKTDALVLQ